MRHNFIEPQWPHVADDGDWTEVSAEPTIEQQDDASVPSNSQSQYQKGNPDPEEDGIVIVENEEEDQARAAKAIRELENDLHRLTLETEAINRKYNELALSICSLRKAWEGEPKESARRVEEAYESRVNQARDAFRDDYEKIIELKEKVMLHKQTISDLMREHQAKHLASSTMIQTLTQQCMVLEQHNKSLKEELIGITSHYKLRTRSPPSTTNLSAGHVSISIHGQHFAFIGPLTAAIYVPSETITMDGKHLHEYPILAKVKNGCTRDICEMGWGGVVVFNSQTDVFGENGQVVLNCETEVSSPAGVESDKLENRLRDVQSACRITHLALGETQGTWCISYIQPNNPLAETSNPTHVAEIVRPGGRRERSSYIKRVWWGKDDVWLAEKVDGTYVWCDKLRGKEGYYYGLTVVLTNDFARCKTIKALSMDKTDGQSWVLVFDNGTVAYSQKVGFDKFQFEEWASQNFGCNFGLVEKPDGYNSAARYGRVEKVKKEEEDK